MIYKYKLDKQLLIIESFIHGDAIKRISLNLNFGEERRKGKEVGFLLRREKIDSRKYNFNMHLKK